MLRVATANTYLASTASIDADQSALMTTEAELASGKQINSPADNPVGAGQASLLQSNVSQLGQFSSNQSLASGLLNNASSTVTSAINVLQSVNTVLVEAGDGQLTSTDASAFASQLQQSLNQLVGLSNTSDGQGGYLFGGSVNSTPPFVQDGNNVSYVGDNLVPGVQISQTRVEQVKYSGSSVFMDIPTGNGTFVTAAGANNTGSGSIDGGTVTSPGALTGDDYTISIGAGNAYTVTDNTTNSVVKTGTLTSGSPTSISFAGMQVAISGTPASGDTFTVTPSTYQSIFTTLANVVSALQAPNGAAAQQGAQSNAITAGIANVQQAMTSLETTQAAMGSQLAELKTYGTINSDQTLQDQTESSSIVDLNYAQAASQLSQQQTQFQAALESYASISKLSLFNYITG